MRSPSKPSFLGTVVALLLVFLLCTGSISSVFARVPLVRRQSNNGVETQWAAHTLPGVVDGPGPGPGPEMGNDNNNILNNNEQVLADTIPVCCTLKEPLIEKTSTICEQGNYGLSSLSILQVLFDFFFLSLPFLLKTPFLETFYVY